MQSGQQCFMKQCLLPVSTTCFLKEWSSDVRLHMQMMTKANRYYHLIAMTRTTKKLEGRRTDCEYKVTFLICESVLR